MDLDTRPVPVYHNSDWRDMGQRSSEAGPSSTRSGRSSVSSNSMSSRRRSSAAPPLGPPPDIPIPTLPALSEISPISGYSIAEDYTSSAREHDDGYHSSMLSEPPVFNLNSFQRPTASSQLTAVTQFSQARFAASSISPHTPVSGNLSDSPPRSLLPRNPPPQSPPQVPSSEPNLDRLHLSPPDMREGGSNPHRPSPRRALSRALELAREAVRLDSTNEDPHGAIQAYARSVDLLNEVMKGVMRGEETTEHRGRNGRRRSIVAQEEEQRRLRSIHDTYRDRMNILSLIYSIPPGGQTSSPPSRPDSRSSEASRDSQPTIIDDSSRPHRVQAPALNGRSRTSSQQSDSASNSGSPPDMSILVSPQHSQHSQHDGMETTNSQPHNRTSIVTRMRSSSNLPPQPPCPSSSPPSTPSVADTRISQSPPRLSVPANAGTRSRGNSVSHRRGGSGSRLEALKEEVAQNSLKTQPEVQYEQETTIRKSSTPGDSPPLPDLPSSSDSDHSSSVTPRVPTSVDQSSIISNGIHPAATNSRIRGGSTVSDTTGTKGRQLLISESTTNGTIFQRREKNKSISSTILEGTTDGFEVVPSKRMTNSSLPSSTVPATIGRSRASSHPVRPSVPIQGLPLELGTRTAQIITSNSSVQPPRKTSVIRHSPQPLSLRTSQLPSAPSSSFASAALSLVPPPPVLPHLPTTPTSPLPPIPPSDSLRKPYHLMNLLGHTMSSKSGGYITRKLHVPYDVWSQGGAKLTNLPEKIHVLDVLCDALLAVQEASVEFAGPMGVASGMGLGVGSITRKDGEIWVQRLDSFLMVCDNVVSSFGKKLSVGEGFVVKKSSGVGSWGGKLTRQLDKLTNGKNLDSPAMYVQGLQKLFHLTQLLDEHTMAIDSQPMAPVYASLPPDIRSMLELKLKRSSEFFASVVLTFVIRDLSQLLDKYAKKGEKWLAE